MPSFNGSLLDIAGRLASGIALGITLAMGILPQELPVIMIVFFAFGARRIAVSGCLPDA